MVGSRSFLMAMVVAAVMVAATATALAQPGAEDEGKRPSGASLGIDAGKGRCPTAEPQKLPSSALAGATRTALDAAPGIYPGNTRNRYAEAAYRGMQAPVNKFYVSVCPDRREYGRRLQKRSVQVDMIFPEYGPGASLRQHWVFVARFDGEYRVWGVYR